MMEDKFNDDLKKEKEETLGEILDRPTELSEEQKAEIAKEGEFLKKELTATKSNLSMRQIARDGDLCIRFLEQEIAIMAKANELEDNVVENIEKIDKVITKPELVVEPFIAKELPEEPQIESFKRADVFLGKKISFDKNKNILLSIIATIVLGLIIGFFFSVLSLEIDNVGEYFKEIELKEKLSFVLRSLIAAAIFDLVFTIFLGKYIAIKGILVAFYYIIEVITYPVLLIINICRKISYVRNLKDEEYEYQYACSKINEENRRKKEAYDSQVRAKRKVFDAAWKEKADERKAQIMIYKLDIARCEYLSDVCREAMTISRQSFCLPDQYNTIEIKKDLLNRMKNMFVYDLVETIDRYEKEKEGKQRFEVEQKARNQQLEVLQKMSLEMDRISKQVSASNQAAREAQQRQIKELEQIRSQNAEMLRQQKQSQEKQAKELEKISKNTQDVNDSLSYWDTNLNRV
ncbi:MAG: hypothetical protein IJD54_01655 [Clostridia bacterium]|nr:hypothetical protein [Clostridia bacterium]